MEQTPQSHINEARRILKESGWDEARETYYKALRVYLDDKDKYREELADLYLEMAQVVFQLEAWDHMTGKKNLMEDTSRTLTYLIEAGNLFSDLSKRNPGGYGYQTALVYKIFGSLYTRFEEYDRASALFEEALAAMDALETKTGEMEFTHADLLIDYGILWYEHLSDPDRSLASARKAETILSSLSKSHPEICENPAFEELEVSISDLKMLNNN